MAEINLINQETAVIDNGLPYKVVRNSIPNASYLGTKGDLFVGTGVSNDVIIGGDTYKLTKMGKLSVPTLSAEDIGEYILATDSSADNKIAWVSNAIIFESTNKKIKFIKDCLKLDEKTTNPSGKLGIMAGGSASAAGIGTIAIGEQAFIGEAYKNSIAIGSYAQAAGDYSVVMGSNAVSNGSYNIVIGAGGNNSDVTHAEGNRSIIIGGGAFSDSDNTITIGMNSTGNDYGVAIGANINMAGISSVCLATSSQDGKGSNISGSDSIGIGKDVTVSSASSIAIGNQANAGVSSASSIAIGNQANAGDNSAGAIAIGALAAASQGAIAIGSSWFSSQKKTMAQGSESIAIGVGAKSTSQETVAIGVDAIANAGIQLGTGINNVSDTFQVYGWPLLDHNGQVPKERLDDIYTKIDKLSTIAENIHVNTSLSGISIGYNIIYRIGRLCCFTDFVIKFNYAAYTDSTTTITLGTFDRAKFAPPEDRTWRGGIFEKLGSATERVYEGIITVTKEGSINFTYTNGSRVGELSDSFFHISLNWYGAGV